MVKVVSGSNGESITIDTDKSEAKDFQVANDATPTTIYGDVSLFNCRQNGNNLTGNDLSKNDGIRELRCYSNQIEKLDISMQKDLEALFC
jgi:internalin-related protein